jgi:hypothetical protein
MTQPTPRELLLEADRQRALARGADMIGVHFRLGRGLVQAKRTGIIGWWRDRSTAPDEKLVDALDPNLMHAIYAAAMMVKRDAERQAADLEARVQTTGESRR